MVPTAFSGFARLVSVALVFCPQLAEEGTMSTIDPMTSNELFSFSTDTSVSR